ncbi:quinate utilization oxidoreductase protein [Metarhizium brunneum]
MKNYEAKLVAVVDSSPAGSALATELSVSYYTGVDNLLNSAEQVDASIICTPNHTKVHLATKFASRIIRMVIEKPVSTDVRSGQDLVNYLSSAKSKVLSYLQESWVTYWRYRIWALHKPLDYFQAPAEWRRTEASGAILINMIHEIDILDFLLGCIV